MTAMMPAPKSKGVGMDDKNPDEAGAAEAFKFVAVVVDVPAPAGEVDGEDEGEVDGVVRAAKAESDRTHGSLEIGSR